MDLLTAAIAGARGHDDPFTDRNWIPTVGALHGVPYRANVMGVVFSYKFRSKCTALCKTEAKDMIKEYCCPYDDKHNSLFLHKDDKSLLSG